MATAQQDTLEDCPEAKDCDLVMPGFPRGNDVPVEGLTISIWIHAKKLTHRSNIAETVLQWCASDGPASLCFQAADGCEGAALVVADVVCLKRQMAKSGMAKVELLTFV